MEDKRTMSLGELGRDVSIQRPYRQLYGKEMKSTEDTFKEIEGVAKKGIDIFKKLMERAKSKDIRKLEKQVHNLREIQTRAERKTELLKERESIEKKLRQMKVLI